MLCSSVEGLQRGAFVVAVCHGVFYFLTAIGVLLVIFDSSLLNNYENKWIMALETLMIILTSLVFHYLLFDGTFKKDVKKLKLWINFSTFFTFPFLMIWFVAFVLTWRYEVFLPEAILIAVLVISIKVVKDLETKLSRSSPVSNVQLRLP